ncbi:N-acetylglucosamine-6-sulfatase-like isoform X2 [Corticium candelabrum]|uniref:N-acetylglucosamine-6-sulfatase-like isoform X2 n=1 Tax=Corticium candelabrum TaxID=121492 RepID=UPI002E261E7C|nr:N-acetylglucosamine-6-sulfatase-like isoform X2 [Corticium candelabrum]
MSCIFFALFVASLTAVASKQPNIVFIITDDQDVKLDSLSVQPKVQKLLTDEGLFFKNAFVTHPVCCPSRSSTLTGKYTHNHQTYENNVNRGCNAQSWRDRNENKTIGAYMSRAGYTTGFFGKYLNNYALKSSGMNASHVPPGWHKWFGLVGNSRFYHYSVSNDGVEEAHGNDYKKDYFTDVVKRQAIAFIGNVTESGKDSPFFMYVSTPAPHRPATPAPQYNHTFDGRQAPRTPSYHYDGTDKHWIISKGTPHMNNQTVEIVDQLFRQRWETLLSVDDLVEELLATLEKKNLMNNTFIFYNSDHGYHLGQFNQQGEKRQPYDEDIRVPLIVRGPGIAKNQTADTIALNIDLLPTFIDLAGGEIPDDVDGRSLKPILMGQTTKNTWRSDFLVEYWGEGNPCMGHMASKEQVFLHDCHNNTFVGIRSLKSGDNTLYAEFFANDSAPVAIDNFNFEEYYDLDKDYWQLHNMIHQVDPNTRTTIRDRLKKFATCSGTSCHI